MRTDMTREKAIAEIAALLEENSLYMRARMDDLHACGDLAAEIAEDALNAVDEYVEREMKAAFMGGFDVGWDEGKDDNYPVKWMLDDEFRRWYFRTHKEDEDE